MTIGHGDQTVREQLLIEQVGLNSLAPGFDGPDSGHFQQSTDTDGHSFGQTQ